MYKYQEDQGFFAQVPNEFKNLAQEELIFWGAEEVRPVYRGLFFKASKKNLYAINYSSFLISRILAPLISFRCHSDRYLYKQAYQINWEDFLSTSDTLAIFANVSHSNIKHSKFAALRLKDAIVDYFRDKFGERPSIDTINPDLWLNLYINKNEATISLDTSGGSLHRRGYRQETVQAPMMETLAAAIVRYTDWQGDLPFYDLCCGSGTILAEAFLYASNSPAGLLRSKFGFQKLPDFNETLWSEVKEKVKQRIKIIPKNLIVGSDLDFDSVKTAEKNLSLIPGNSIEVRQIDLFDLPNLKDRIIVCNPPYGKRIGQQMDLDSFYKRLGDFLKQKCSGSIAYIYFGDRKYLKKIGLRSTWKKQLFNGGLDGRLAKFELY